MRPQVNLQPILAVVDFATKQTHMGFLLLSQLIGYVELNGLRAVEHGYFPVDAILGASLVSGKVVRQQRWVIAIKTKIQFTNTLPIILNCVIGIIN